MRIFKLHNTLLAMLLSSGGLIFPALSISAADRSMDSFGFLLKRSPFSLPTAEEKSPLSERYDITGAASWDGVQRVFVFDKNSQQRHVLETGQESEGMTLLEFLPAGDPREMRARVQVGSEVATLSFAQPKAQPQANTIPVPPTPHGTQPGLPKVIQNAGAASPQSSPSRRIIKRRIIRSNAPTPPSP